MKKEIYIIKNGKLFSDRGTISFVDEEGNKKTFPVKNISDIYCLGAISLTQGVIKRVLENELNIHFLTKYGTYRGSLNYASILDGKIIRNQVIASLEFTKRIELSKEILASLQNAMRYFLIRYMKKGHDVRKYKEQIEKIDFYNIQVRRIEELLQLEAEMWKSFYKGFREIIKKSEFDFEKREYNPPKGEINAMISFGNMILYSEVYSLIKQVGLLPEIGFLHESNYKRYTLALDVSEMFKPVVVFSTIAYLVNKKKINKYDFDNSYGYTYLNDEGKYTYLQELTKRFNKTFFIKELGRESSIKFLIKRELQKLKLFYSEGIKYFSYKRWYECL